MADFLKSDLKLFIGEKYNLIGNFPYNISSQIMFNVLENKNHIDCVVGMFQREVALRIAEKPGTKVYGILSVLLQAFYDIEYLFTVNENVFNPPPKVKSAVIRLTRNKINKLDKTNISQLLKFASFNCKHLLHDEIWLKFTKNNFVCDMEDDYKEIYCNTINKSDVKTKEFIDFVAKLEKFDYNVRLVDFDENDNEEYNNDLLIWVVVPIPL
jgi:16S rRNA A1518/A1519 N6-dimethyltransferase RsmA/KsgA/DIM1 with predicted DNA glycosylase/AP lyase activity